MLATINIAAIDGQTTAASVVGDRPYPAGKT